MPSHSHALPTHSREEFCLSLKAARECKGLALATIADATKIASPLFAALERGDLRNWPKGLHRRCFFKEYVRMIGVPVAEACAEFVRLFPDDEASEIVEVAMPKRRSLLDALAQFRAAIAATASRVS